MVKIMMVNKSKSGSTTRHFPRLPNETTEAYIARAWKSSRRRRRSPSTNSIPSPSVISPSSPSLAGPSSTATVSTSPEPPLSIDFGVIEPALMEGSASDFDADPSGAASLADVEDLFEKLNNLDGQSPDLDARFNALERYNRLSSKRYKAYLSQLGDPRIDLSAEIQVFESSKDKFTV